MNSGPGTGIQMEYRYSENTQKLALRAALLFWVYSEFIQNELKHDAQEQMDPLSWNIMSNFHKNHPDCSCFLY